MNRNMPQPGVGPDEVWALSTAQYVVLTDNAETRTSSCEPQHIT